MHCDSDLYHLNHVLTYSNLLRGYLVCGVTLSIAITALNCHVLFVLLPLAYPGFFSQVGQCLDACL